MINIVTTISTEFNNLRRVIKFLRFGKSDVQTAVEVGPYGVDSNPIKDMSAIYAQTGEKGKTVIIGYMNKNQLAEVGETRLYSTDANGSLKTFIWLKADGIIELGGNSHNLVRFTPLDSELKKLVDFINKQLPLIASGIATGGGSYTPGTASIDISDAKINEIKTL